MYALRVNTVKVPYRNQGHPTTSFGRYLFDGGWFALGFRRRSKSALRLSQLEMWPQRFTMGK